MPIPVPYADFGDPQSLNLYTYVRNIPTTNIDADGHCDASGVQNCSAWDHVAGAIGELLNIIPETGNLPIKLFNGVSGHFGGPQLEEAPLIQPDEHASQAGINLGIQAQVAIPAAQAAADARAAGIVVGEVRTATSGAATEKATAGARAGEAAPAPYNRSEHYGNPATSKAASEIRAAGEGKPCPSCGQTMKSGTKTAPTAQHTPTLRSHYYSEGHKMTPAQRRAYARSSESMEKGAVCKTCQSKEGASEA
jgi:hypothetical protein